MWLEGRVVGGKEEREVDNPENQGCSTEELEERLQEKVSFMETQCARVENEYVNKIKELRNRLQERKNKEIQLTTMVDVLRKEFSEHVEEINNIRSGVAKETQRQNQLRLIKHNSSPALLRKSYGNQKKVEKHSTPTAHTVNPSDHSRELNFSGENSDPRVQVKKYHSQYSPSFPSKRLGFSVTQQNPPQPKPVVPTMTDKLGKYLNKNMPPILEKNYNPPKSPQLTVKKLYSPKGKAELRTFLRNELKTMEDKPLAFNEAQKRVIRYLQRTNASSTTAVPKTEPRRAKGYPKETMESF